MGELDIVHKAIYIDNPFVIDELSKFNDLDVMNETLKICYIGATMSQTWMAL